MGRPRGENNDKIMGIFSYFLFYQHLKKNIKKGWTPVFDIFKAPGKKWPDKEFRCYHSPGCYVCYQQLV